MDLGVKWVRRYISDVVAWLFRGPLIAVVVAGMVVLVVFASLPCLERQIRISGMALQLVGVILVGVGLRDTRRAFDDQPTVWGTIKRWWSGRPKFGPQHHVLHAKGASFATSFGKARARVSAGPDTPLERRVAILEQEFKNLFDEVGLLDADAKKKTDELSNAIEVEQSRREQADIQIKNQLRKAVAEGIPLGAVGVFLFLLGITAGTASPEIASIFASGTCQ